MNELLMKVYGDNFGPIAFVDDIVILISASYHFTDIATNILNRIE